MPTIISPPLLLDSAGQPANGTIFARATGTFMFGTDTITTAGGFGEVRDGALYQRGNGGAFFLPPTPTGFAFELVLVIEERYDGRNQKKVITRTVSVPDTATATWLTLVDVVPETTVNYILPAWITELQADLDAATSVNDLIVTDLADPASGSTFSTALSNTYVSQGQLVADAADAPGVDPTGVTECSAALQAFLDACETAGVRAFARGTFRTTGTITIAVNADMGDATISYSGTGVAVQIGKTASVLQRRHIVAPRVVYSPKVAAGWDAGRVGIRLSSSYACVIVIPHIKNFERGLQMFGQNNQGVSYNTVTIGGLDNNKINMEASGDATGWVNQNVFIGGRYSHDAAEGTLAAGTRHIYLADLPASRPNGNMWVNASVESVNIVEFAIDVESGQYNRFENVRLEDTTGVPRIRLGAKAQQNTFAGGFGLSNAAITRIAGNTRNSIICEDRIELQGVNQGTLRVENSASSGFPAIAVYNAATMSAAYSPGADYSVGLFGTGIKVKGKTDTNERIRLEGGGNLFLGNGIAAPVVYLSGNALSLSVNGGPLRLPSYTTAGRPSASTVGAGAVIFDSTLGYLVTSNGTNWRNGIGTAV